MQTQDDDWLNDSAEQLQAEDALWDAANARHGDKFAALVQAARDEIEAGATRSMVDEHGEFVDELTRLGAFGRRLGRCHYCK